VPAVPGLGADDADGAVHLKGGGEHVAQLVDAVLSDSLHHLVDGDTLTTESLVDDGQIIPGHLRRAGISVAALSEALRQRGEPDAAELRQVILEPDGTIHVIRR
jgi:uncharacterized membrane protein YcaP (DUF421 family)